MSSVAISAQQRSGRISRPSDSTSATLSSASNGASAPAVLQVSEPRTPCWKLGMRLGDPAFPRAFARARRPGVLLRVLREGTLQARDVIEVSSVPAHGVTAAEVTAMYYGDHVDTARIVAAHELAAHWP
jgi:MOSC domain-containing protein YiiM